MPLGEFDKYYAEYESKIKNASKLVTYCHGVGCKLSDKVSQRLYRDKGHKNVASFFGGWPQWSQANLPVE
jgi:3-mercaptopyruvate sulfurtransferase SseA